MRDISDKSCGERKTTHFLFNDFFENRAVYEIIWKNIVEPDRPQENNIIRVMPIAY